MAQVGYCNECGHYVELTPQGECPEGHPRSALRGVHEGVLPEAPAPSSAPAKPAAAQPERPDGEIGLFAQVLGKSIIIVPVALIVAWGMWTGYEQFSGPVIVRLALSAGSLLLTVGVTFILVGRRRHR